MRLPRFLRRLAILLGRSIVFGTVAALILAGAALAVLETGWAKNQIRRLIVRQANQYLTATLEIGRLRGSLLRGIELGDIRLSRDGRTLIAIDDVSLSYSIRDLLGPGVVIKRIHLVRPRVIMARTSEGRWDLVTLVRREAREQRRTGPGRPIEIGSIEIDNGRVVLADPLDLGAVHAPTRYEALDVRAAFVYQPVRWRLAFAHAAWLGFRPDLTVTRLSGGIENGPDGIAFRTLAVETPGSRFTLTGRVMRDDVPAVLDLRVHAERFVFQEWAGVLRGLKDIAVEAAFDTELSGPLAGLNTVLQLHSTGGSIAGGLVLDTRVPGWHGAGTLDVGRLDLSKWLNNPERPSDITGRVAFDLDLDLGRHFPRGSYAFSGPHAEFMHYAADDLRARGAITEREVLITQATARAYGGDVVAAGSSAIAVDRPFPFRFQGSASHLDLRRLPASIPVPHVTSELTFDYDVTGRFANGFIAGHATFARSTLVGAILDAGTIGTIDTGASPIRFGGVGAVRDLDLARVGAEFDVGWLRNPRYAGTVSGAFRVTGSGTDRRSLTLSAAARIARARVFHGEVRQADVTLEIAGGTLRTSYEGAFTGINPAIPFAESRLAASLTGSAAVRIGVEGLLVRTPAASDYDIDGRIALGPSEIRGIRLDRALIAGRFKDRVAELGAIEVSGPALEGRGHGTLAFASGAASDFHYDISRADLAALQPLSGLAASGRLSTTGRATGHFSGLSGPELQGPGLQGPELSGQLTIDQLAAAGVQALTVAGQYDAALGALGSGRRQSSGRFSGHASFVTVARQQLDTVEGTLTWAERRVGFDLQATRSGGRTVGAAGALGLVPDERAVDLEELTVRLDHAAWRLTDQPSAVTEPLPSPSRIKWSDDGLDISLLELMSEQDASQRLAVSGTWRSDGAGALQIKATHVFLETLQGVVQQPVRYGGVLDLEATIRGTRQAPVVSGWLRISNGRVQRFSYDKLSVRVDLSGGLFHVDGRLDQSPGVWLTAAGIVPPGVFDRTRPEREIDLTLASSSIDLGLVEGLTSVVRNVGGRLRLEGVKVVGTSRDPHFQGRVDISNAAFQVVPSGVRYKNGRATLTLARDRINVEALHLEDGSGRTLEIRGGLGTHELKAEGLKAGRLELEVAARHLDVMRNEFGRLEIDATLHVRGRFDLPQVSGAVTITSGNLNVDTILDRVVFQPYATAPLAPVGLDAIAVLNPWDRLSLNVELHVPDTLRLTGQSVQVSPGTPIGLGDVNLRVGGDLSFYKDASGSPFITGSLDSISGTYGFQGRRFDVDETSSINFHGNPSPGLSVSVTRLISGITTRVTISGDLQSPELTLSSVPPLEASDVLSLVVFNTSLSELTPAEQQELAVRAGTLAAGFVAQPLVSALESSLGLESLAIEPGSDIGATGPRVTVGEEIAPGLVARFSRQFGNEPYDQATLEYYLSRLFRIRATFSDAGSLIAVSPFRRIERAGIDVLFFLSF